MEIKKDAKGSLMNMQKEKIYRILGISIILLVSLGLVFVLYEFKLYQNTYRAVIEYSVFRTNENITVVPEIVQEDSIAQIIIELNISRCYRIYWGDFNSKDNSGTVEKDLSLGYTKGFYKIPLQITRETYFRLIWQPNSSEFGGYHVVQCNFVDT